jgi:hypothetical protein
MSSKHVIPIKMSDSRSDLLRAEEAEVLLRNATPDDCSGIGELAQRNGVLEEWSGTTFLQLWSLNPSTDSTPSMGWILEHRSKIVGYIGSIPLSYHFQGRNIKAAAATCYVVDVEYRRHSLRLAKAFFSQNGVELLLNTSSNVPSGRVFQLFKAKKIPQLEYDTVLVLIVKSDRFLRSYFQTRGTSHSLAALTSFLLAPILSAYCVIRRPKRHLVQQSPITVSSSSAECINEEFEQFWKSTAAEKQHCIMRNRSPEWLRWHIRQYEREGRSVSVLTARREKLVGYIILATETLQKTGLRRCRVMDLIAESDDSGVIDSLFMAAIRSTKENGTDVFELIGFPGKIRKHFEKYRPLKRKLPYWQFWYKPLTMELAEHLQNETAWYGCPLDGDATLL